MSALGPLAVLPGAAAPQQDDSDTYAALTRTRRAADRPFVVTPEDFGAQGDAVKTGSGWRGSDDVAAINRAIEALRDRGGGELVVSRPHLLASAHGQIGTRLAGQDSPNALLDYAIGLYPNVKITFIGRGGFYAASGANAPTTRLACMALVGPDRFVRNVAVAGGTIRGFFIGLTALIGRAVEWHIDQVRFVDCGIAILNRAMEQCSFRDIAFLNCGAGIVSGGFWVHNVDRYDENGGYADKNLFSNIRSESSWDITQRGRPLDEWFDRAIYRTDLDTTLTPRPDGKSIVRLNRYTGVCGYAIRLMTRYNRPSSSNFFDLVSHMNSARSAIKIDNGVANACGVVYCENVGYVDGQGRRVRIGYEATDPYLGPGKRVPYLVYGVAAIMTMDVQHTIANRITDARSVAKISQAWADIADPRS